MKSPAFQIYVNDILGSAKFAMMTTEEVGAYMLLLFLDWQEGGFVYDPKRLAKWCRLTPAKFLHTWKEVGPCFEEIDGRLWNPRLRAERAKQAAWREKAAKGAAITNEKRWDTHRPSDRPSDEIATPVATEDSSLDGRIPLPMPSPLPVTTSSSSSGATFEPVHELLSRLPPESRPAWSAVIDAARQGMHGPPMTSPQIDAACTDYVGNGHTARPSLRHFRAYLANAAKAPRANHASPHSKQAKARSVLAGWVGDSSEVPDGQ